MVRTLESFRCNHDGCLVVYQDATTGWENRCTDRTAGRHLVCPNRMPRCSSDLVRICDADRDPCRTSSLNCTYERSYRSPISLDLKTPIAGSENAHIPRISNQTHLRGSASVEASLTGDSRTSQAPIPECIEARSQWIKTLPSHLAGKHIFPYQITDCTPLTSCSI